MFAHIISGAESAASIYYYTISANDNGVDLWADIIAANGGTPAQSTIQVTINAGVEIGAVSNSSPTNYALDVSNDFATNGKTLVIINNGYIGGFGGDGGEFDVSLVSATAGQNGGVGINFDSPATLINNGTIAGGGGGGGGNTGSSTEPGGPNFYADGGGGAGLPPGSAGGGYLADPNNFGASDGTKTNGGLASLAILGDEDPGGNGGNRGQAGVSPPTGKAGGAAGYSYQLGSLITVNYSGSGSLIGSVLS